MSSASKYVLPGSVDQPGQLSDEGATTTTKEGIHPTTHVTPKQPPKRKMSHPAGPVVATRHSGTGIEDLPRSSAGSRAGSARGARPPTGSESARAAARLSAALTQAGIANEEEQPIADPDLIQVARPIVPLPAGPSVVVNSNGSSGSKDDNTPSQKRNDSVRSTSPSVSRNGREASHSAAATTVTRTKTNKLSSPLSVEMTARDRDELKAQQEGLEKNKDASLVRIHPSSSSDQDGTGITVLAPSMTAINEQPQDLVALLEEIPVPSGYIHPSSPFLLWWSYTLMAVALYNLFTVPYRWTFWSDPITITWDVILLVVIDAVGDLFFLGEIFKNLRVGFYEDGKLNFDPKKIRQRYFRSWWFVLDIVTCLPFDIIQAGEGHLNPPVRILKVLRIFQLLHHISIVEASRSVSLPFKLAKLFFYTSIIAHVAACIKYPIIIKNPTLAPLFESKSEFARYLLTFYWGLGNLIDRGDSNSPYEVGDYFLSAATMFVGVIWVSNFVAAMDQYTDSADSTKKRHLEEYKQVKQFMSKMAIPAPLQTQVKAYYSYLWGSPARYDLSETLDKLSATLRADVTVAMKNCVSSSPLFEGLSQGYLATLVASVRRQISLPNEVLCRDGMLGMEIFFIEDGLVEVLLGPGQAVIATLRVGEHFGEFSVILGTFRTATVRAMTYCTLLVIEKKDLQESFESFPLAEGVLMANAQKMKVRTDLQEKSFMAMHHTGQTHRSKLQQLMANQPSEQEDAKGPAKKPAWTISHLAPWYVVWESIHIAFVLYNSIMIPVMIAFASRTTNPAIWTLNYLGDLFMIIDIFLCFRVTYVHNGSEVKDLGKIRQNYMSSRFKLHVIASLPLDFFMLATGIQPYLRINRVLRIADAHELINIRIRDSRLPDVFALIYLCVNLLFISHWFGCIYWVLSGQAGFTAASSSGGWQPSASLLDEGSKLLDYITAFYWALGLLVGYGNAFYPPNYYAVVFTLVIQLTGLFLISYLIGVLGNTAGTLQVQAAAATEEVDQFTEAAKFSHWGDDLVKRCSVFLKHSWDMQKGIDPNLALFKLPVLLRTEIMSCICGPLIRSVRRLSSLDEACLHTLVAELRFEEFPRGEYVFRQGYEGSQMFFIAKGVCDILVDNGTQEVTLKTIGPGCFFGEGALFSGLRSASVRCTTSVLLYSLSSESFLSVMHAHPEFASSLLSAHQTRHEKIKGVKSSGTPKQHRTPAMTARKMGSDGGGEVMQIASPSGGGNLLIMDNATASPRSPSDIAPGETDAPEAHKTKLAAAVAHMLERYGHTRASPSVGAGTGTGTNGTSTPVGERATLRNSGSAADANRTPFMHGLGAPDLATVVNRAMAAEKAPPVDPARRASGIKKPQPIQATTSATVQSSPAAAQSAAVTSAAAAAAAAMNNSLLEYATDGLPDEL